MAARAAAAAQIEVLSATLAGQVVERLGLEAFPPPDFGGLRTLYSMWCRRVPMDNVRKRIHLHHLHTGPLPGDDATEFFEAWLRHGTGGTCWSANGALHALLQTLNFDAARGVGTMLVAPDVPPNHGSVAVRIDGARYLVDASMLHNEPLLLAPMPTAIEHPAWGVRCENRDGKWHVRWRPLNMPDGMDCRIEHLGASRAEFAERHERTRTRSGFNHALYVRLIRGDSMVGIANGERVAIDRGGVVHRTPLVDDDRIRFLVDEAGLSEEIARKLPADLPPPA